MIKYYDYAVTFAEFPDEIALCVNITNCPGTCEKCSEPYLREDIGTELTIEKVDELIKSHPDISLFGFMGGDSDHATILALSKYIHENYDIKVGMYSGKDFIDTDLALELDCYKIGRFILPKGPEEEWYKHTCGPIVFPFSNQFYFERRDGKLYDCTYKFRRNPIDDLKKYIID